MSQNLPAGDFKWVKKHLNLMKILLKTNEDIFLKLISNVWENYMKLTVINHFHKKEWKLESLNDKGEYLVQIRTLKKH